MSGPVPRILFLVLFLGIGGFYYFFFGPGPTLQDLSQGLPWWRPRGWALRWPSFAELAGMARSGWPSILLPVLIFCIPPVTLTGMGFALFRSALLRTVLLALGLSLCFFVVYGYIAEGAIWRFFSWRFLATAPRLPDRSLRRRPPIRAGRLQLRSVARQPLASRGPRAPPLQQALRRRRARRARSLFRGRPGR